MNKLILRTSLMVLLLFSTFGASKLFAEELSADELSANAIKKSEFKKELSKEFSISSKGKVTVTGKYGDINVSTWDKNKVKFDVTIVVQSTSKSKADNLLERININFKNGNDYAKAIFEMEEGSGNWWKDYKGTSYKIHYNVKLPASNSVELYNKYGKIHLGDIKGDATLENKYGDIKAGDIGGDLTLILGYAKNSDFGKVGGDLAVTMKYSKIDVESVGNVKATSKYSQIYIDKAGDIKADSKYDKYYLGTIGDLRNYGKYDDFEIKSVKNMDIASKYSDFDIKELNGKADFDMEYGDVDVVKVGSSFKGIEFSGKYTDLIVDLQGSGAKLDIKTEYTKVKLPSETQKTHHHKDGNDLEIEGAIGAGSALIKASARYGSVIIYR